jgi:hypothetical protein
MDILEPWPAPPPDRALSLKDYNVWRQPFYGKAEYCQHCGKVFAPGEMAYIIWDLWPPDRFKDHWAAVCNTCFDNVVEGGDIDAPDPKQYHKQTCKGCGRQMFAPRRGYRRYRDHRGNTVHVRTNHVVTAEVCSNRCAQRVRRRLKRAARDKVNCTECGKSFQPKRSDTQFCSNACRQKAYRQR